MNRLFIFDLDGVLVDSKEIHYVSLNNALAEIDLKYVIDEESQKTIFEGLTTNQKLKILTETRGLPEHTYDKIWKTKQEISISFFNLLEKDMDLVNYFNYIKNNNIKIAVASNSIKKTLESALVSLGLMELVDFYISNEDVSSPKPNPEMYKKCIKTLGAEANTTTIFEDSYIGRTAAVLSGARLISIKDRANLSLKVIKNEVDKFKFKPNVLIPMAGEGSRFKSAGYNNPKPLIDVNGKTMIQTVVDNIGIDARYIFVARKEDENKYKLSEYLPSICKDFILILQDKKLDGAALSALLAKDYINNDSPLIIANSDQYLIWNNKKTIKEFIKSGIDGAILTFSATDTKWSFVKQNKFGFVDAVAEKNAISDEATCGVYYWKTGKDFIKYTNEMILNGNKTNNEFYICPVYNEAIKDEKIIKSKMVYEMWGLVTPEDLATFIEDHI
ncbi:HAD_like domain containing protein [uncultured Caudovirales phage]|uniref:HAD_like domain containing protein n=1 Tax=uncultured Caudovirales phage TaxID=2100421 RepID=A0A6J5QF00_9CAUD|nr:HAD_like domain containing protein [uncultured Caudovirales phage]CAB4150719.1 HAD_like domain containing protein [uncultured Caudovirales phage]CAB4175271.1 HAD_like domain containing protein [uncultured Caudovirales phage]CAB4179695.1 HAD_like domain containing protein [uncultured Caudovirales phage]CAB4185824.1 HAD_like domain containing protein [uncultured Caudovirales phage]